MPQPIYTLICEEPLNRQEVRNVAFPGVLNEEIIDLSAHEFLQRQLKIRGENSAAYVGMADVEYVLRFMTLFTGLENYSGNLAASMDSFMLENQHAAPGYVEYLREKFLLAISRCEELWGECAFRRWDANAAMWRNQMIGGMFDAQMIAAAMLDEKQFHAALEDATLLARTKRLFEDPEFESSVRVQTNTPSKLKRRIRSVRALFEMD